MNPTVLAFLNAQAKATDPNTQPVTSYTFDPKTGWLQGKDAKGNDVVANGTLALLAQSGGTLYNVTNAPKGTGMIYTMPNGQDNLFGNIDANTLSSLASALGVHANIANVTYAQYAATRGAGRFNMDAAFNPDGTPKQMGQNTNNQPGVYAGGAADNGHPPGTPGSVSDPFPSQPDTGEQPYGQGFGSDYGLSDIIGRGDPNFAFGPGPTSQTPLGGPGGHATVVGSTQTFGGVPTPPQIVGSTQTFGAANPPGVHPGSVLGAQTPTPVSASNLDRFNGTTPITTTGVPGQATVVGSTKTFTAPAGSTTATGATATGTTTATTGTATATSDQKNALADLQSVLTQYGLGSLTNWAWNQIQQGASEAQVLINIRDTPEFKARFPAIAARQQAGLPAISPADYVNYENQATQVMRAAGLPSGFWDSPSDFTTLLTNDVSLNELSQRVGMAQQAAFQVPPDVRALLARDYGVSAGGLAAFFLDPKTAEPLLQRDFTSAQIGGAAYRTGYGSNRAEDEQLTDLGVTASQAQQGFSQLTSQRQLFSSLPGENTTGINRDQQLAAAFGGNTLDQEAIMRRAQTRAATFAGGGGFSAGQNGFSGVGQAQGA